MFQSVNHGKASTEARITIPANLRWPKWLRFFIKMIDIFHQNDWDFSSLPRGSAALAYMAEVAYAAGPALQGPRALGQNKKMCAA